MSDNERQKGKAENEVLPTRRKVLGTIGIATGAIAGTGFIGAVSADSEVINQIQDIEPVETLLAEVGNPEITNERRGIQKIGDLKILETNLETEIGTVVHLKVVNSNSKEFNQGDTSVAFEIEDLTQEIREELPRKFNSLPIGVSLSIKQEEGETTLVTTVTEKEKKQLAELVGTEEFVAQYVNDYYHVLTSDNVRYEISVGGKRPEIREPSVETLVTTQIDQDACYDCVVNTPLASCGTCIQHCMPGDAFAPLQCPYCIVDKCADSDVIACGKCIASAAEHIPNPF